MAVEPRPVAVIGHAEPSAVFAPVLVRLDVDAAAYFHLTRLRLVPRGYENRPFSHLMRVEVRCERDSRLISRLFVKVFKSKTPAGADAMRVRVMQDYETTRRAHAWMAPHGDLGVVPPIACYPEHLAIVTEEVQGATLLDYLRRRAGWLRRGRLDELSAIMAAVGRWVRVFQGIDVPGTYVTLDALRQYIDQRLQRLVREADRSFTPADRARVLRHIDALGSQIPGEELAEVAVHADMSLGNLLVADRRIVGLDFAMSKHGTSLHDLTRLFLQLNLLAVKPFMPRSDIHRLQEAMIKGFDPSLTSERPLFRLLLLLHRINHLTSLSVNRASLPVEMYNGVVRRQHRKWLAAELQRTGAAV